MISIKLQANGALFQGRGFEIYKQELKIAMTESVLKLETEVVRKTPVFLSFLRSGIQGKVISPFKGEVGVVGPANIYAAVVEFGRRPGGKFPPPDAIKKWLKGSIKGRRFVEEIKASMALTDSTIAFGGRKKAKRKIKKDTALNSATFLKSRAIARDGTKGVFMFQKAEKKLKRSIEKRFNKAVSRANARM